MVQQAFKKKKKKYQMKHKEGRKGVQKKTEKVSRI